MKIVLVIFIFLLPFSGFARDIPKKANCLDSICLGQSIENIDISWSDHFEQFKAKKKFSESNLKGIFNRFPHHSENTYLKLYDYFYGTNSFYLTDKNKSFFKNLTPMCNYSRLIGIIGNKSEAIAVTFRPIIFEDEKTKWIITKIKKWFQPKTKMGKNVILKKYEEQLGKLYDLNTMNEDEMFNYYKEEKRHFMILTVYEPRFENYNEAYHFKKEQQLSSKYSNLEACNKIDENAEEKYSKILSTLDKVNKKRRVIL